MTIATWQGSPTLDGEERRATGISPLRKPEELFERATATLHLGILYCQVLFITKSDALESAGRVPDAMERYYAALRLKPEYAEAHSNLGLLLLRQGRAAEALPHLWQTARLAADSAQAHDDLATCLGALGRHEEALRELREAVRLSPRSPFLLSRLALELASAGGTGPARVREAIAQARTACELTQWRDPVLLDALAQIQASAESYEEAMQTGRRAIALARQAHATDLAARIEARLETYRQKGAISLAQAP